MAARRSWLRIRQSPCSLLPCRRLPGRIRQVSYHRGMKMSESLRSCLVSCGTSMFGRLWGWSLRVLGPYMPYCTVSETCQDGISLCNEDRVLFHNCLWHRKYAEASCALTELRK